jgi:hypothetical protein
MYGTTVWRQQNDAVNSYAEARVFLDARDNTEYGMLRTYARIGYGRSSGGDDNSGSQARRAQTFDPSRAGAFGNLQTGFGASEAFVQLGGFLAGRTTSFASAGLSAAQFTTQNPSGGRVNQFAYTASLGNGMSVTAAAEDAAELRQGVHGQTAAATPNRTPDGVVSFDVAQSWGTLKVAGVLHEVHVAGRDTTASSKTGYALMAATRINLPMIAAGDNLQVFGAYGVGAAARTIGNTATDVNNTAANFGFGLGLANANLYDGVQTATNLTLTKSYSYGAKFQHFFTPKVSAYVAGTYGKLDIPGSVQNTGDRKDAAVWGVGLGVIWSPVSGLEINPEVAYRGASLSAVDTISGNAAGEGTSKKSDTAMYYRMRVARSF